MAAHLGSQIATQQVSRIAAFVAERNLTGGNLATDQLLNLLYLLTREVELTAEVRDTLQRTLFRELGSGS